LELFLNTSDLLAHGFALLPIQLRGLRSRQTPMGAVDDGGHHPQIAQQFGAGPGWSFLLRLSLGFEEQLRPIQDAFADRG
jgi:hypothetical protein